MTHRRICRLEHMTVLQSQTAVWRIVKTHNICKRIKQQKVQIWVVNAAFYTSYSPQEKVKYHFQVLRIALLCFLNNAISLEKGIEIFMNTSSSKL